MGAGFYHCEFLLAWLCRMFVVEGECSNDFVVGVLDWHAPTGPNPETHDQLSRTFKAVIGQDVFDNDDLIGVCGRTACTNVGTDGQTVDGTGILRGKSTARTGAKAFPVLIDKQDRAVTFRGKLFDGAGERVEDVFERGTL